MSTTPLRRRTAVVVLAAALFTSMLIPEVQAAPTPGAKCTQRGQERVVKARTLRCTRVKAGGLRWRTVTPATKPGATNTVSPLRAPQVSGISANETRVSFTLSGMSPDTGNYAVQWVTKGASFDSYQMTRVTSRNVSISTDEFRCDLTYTMRVFVMRSDWTGDRGHTTENITPHSELFDVTMHHPCRGGAEATLASCAEGGACVVGDVGPGGGIVFYVEPSGGTFACGRALQSTCRYLEAAPTTGPSAWSDTTYAWSGVTNVAIGSDARGAGIGTGYGNTIAMVTQSSTASRAGTISRPRRARRSKGRTPLRTRYGWSADAGLAAAHKPAARVRALSCRRAISRSRSAWAAWARSRSMALSADVSGRPMLQRQLCQPSPSRWFCSPPAGRPSRCST